MKNVFKINLHKHFLNTDNHRAVVQYHILTKCVYEYLIYWASFARVYLPFSYYVQNSHFIFHTVRNVVIINAFDTCQQSRIMQGRRNRTPLSLADKLTPLDLGKKINPPWIARLVNPITPFGFLDLPTALPCTKVTRHINKYFFFTDLHFDFSLWCPETFHTHLWLYNSLNLLKSQIMVLFYVVYVPLIMG